MGARDPRIDAYIADAADFARPILTHIREVVHRACPDVEETIKWGMPHFERGGILRNMAAFKAHCALGFWSGDRVVGDAAVEGAMGQFGRIASVDDLPPEAVLAGYVEKAVALREAGTSGRRSRTRKAEPAVPEDLAKALEANARARATFEGFAPSHRREYVEWITGAKRADTRARRVATAVTWLEEGKRHNWRYER